MEASITGSKIAAARKKINLSQAQLAEQLSITPQAVGKWERGESVPDIITINRLANILGVDLNYFSDKAITPGAGNNTATAPGHTAPGEKPAQATPPGRDLLMRFSGSNLPEGDFTGIDARKRTFNGSALPDADFSGADLTGSTFMASDLRGAGFEGTNLTDCTFTACDLTDAGFSKAILVRTVFSKLGLDRAVLSQVALTGVQFIKTDLTKAVFKDCSFTGVDFKYADMSGLCLDGMAFTDVVFDNTALKGATFKGAILRNVSFRAGFALTNRYYRALATISFEGARMDKLTYAALKGIGADLSKVMAV